tara:strand:+ start:205 stop:411 length:207 start_codon:yes stop_codon:yes gene_type:complete
LVAAVVVVPVLAVAGVLADIELQVIFQYQHNLIQLLLAVVVLVGLYLEDLVRMDQVQEIMEVIRFFQR